MPSDTSELVERLESHMGAQDVSILLRDCRLAAAAIRRLTPTDTDTAIPGGEVKGPIFPHGCGYACPHRDTINGRCEVHGPTAADAVVDRVTSGFKRDLAAIIRSDK